MGMESVENLFVRFTRHHITLTRFIDFDCFLHNKKNNALNSHNLNGVPRLQIYPLVFLMLKDRPVNKCLCSMSMELEVFLHTFE